MRAGPTSFAIALAAALPGMAGPASAACRCVCYQGRVEARCTASDLTPPICQSLCLESAGQAPIRGVVIDRPLGGGGQAVEPVTPSDPNWQAGPERGSYAYGADPGTGNAPTAPPGAAAAAAAGLGR